MCSNQVVNKTKNHNVNILNLLCLSYCRVKKRKILQLLCKKIDKSYIPQKKFKESDSSKQSQKKVHFEEEFDDYEDEDSGACLLYTSRCV